MNVSVLPRAYMLKSVTVRVKVKCGKFKPFRYTKVWSMEQVVITFLTLFLYGM